MKDKDKLKTNPSEQNVSSEEGENVETSKSSKDRSKEEQELEDEISEASKKLLEPEEDKTEEKTDDSTEETTEDVKKTELDVDAVNKMTGREFKTIEEFTEHYKNLSSFVGSNPEENKKKAEEYDKLMTDSAKIEQDIKKDDVIDDKKDETPLTEDNKQILSNQQEEITKIREELSKERFLRDHPEANSVVDIVETMSKQHGKDLEETYKVLDLESLLNSKKELEEVKSEDKGLGVKSKSRLTPSRDQKISDLVRQLKTAEVGGGKTRDVDQTKQSLVETFLGEGIGE